MSRRLPGITGLLALLLGAGAVVLHVGSQPSAHPVPPPSRVAHARTAAPQPPSPDGTPAIPSAASPAIPPVPTPAIPVVPASDIVAVAIPSVGIDVAASGPGVPRVSEKCRGGSDVCLDPPYPDRVIWYDAYARPETPSTDSVIVLGHANRDNPDYEAFNALGAVADGDTAVITTETGVFTYRAQAAVAIPYADIPFSELVYGHVPGRAVFVTCGDDVDAYVVVADLLTAERLV